jgi:transcriptional regulator of acetoin/glycerol metabolism
VQGLRTELSSRTLTLLTWGSIALNLAAAGFLTALVDHEDSPYYIVAVVPVLVAAFRFSLPALAGVVGVATFLNFATTEFYFRHHLPRDVGEYFEAGIASLSFAIVGLLVWLLVRQIRANENNLARNLLELKQVLESELFGHEKGAFTGADRARQGLFEAAHEGTLFLDEAGEMSMAAQAKLLRILTDGQLLRVGSTKPRSVNVRVLVATHRNLEQRVRDGLFREDLYYRLAVVPIHIPPLRARREDIPLLAELFSRQIATGLHLPLRRLSPQAVESLTQYDFPGNIRELKNLIERAYVLSVREELGPESFPMPRPPEMLIPALPANGQAPAALRAAASLPVEPFDLTDFLEKTEKELILRALGSTSGAQAEAARRMGLSRSALAYELNKYGIRAIGD